MKIGINFAYFLLPCAIHSIICLSLVMKNHRLIWLTLFFCSLCTGTYAQAGKKTYSCTSSEGRTLIADHPIRECADREQFIKGSSGATLAIVPPQLTQRQQALLQAEKDRQEQILKREKEQLQVEQQYQRTLRERYPTIASYDKMRLLETEPIIKKIGDTKNILVTHRQNHDELNIKINAYADPSRVPKDMMQSYEYITHEITTQERFLVSLEQQLEKMNERFSADLKILEPYWKSQTKRTSKP